MLREHSFPYDQACSGSPLSAKAETCQVGVPLGSVKNCGVKNRFRIWLEERIAISTFPSSFRTPPYSKPPRSCVIRFRKINEICMSSGSGYRIVLIAV